MTLSLQPNIGKVIVKIEKEDEKTAGGIFIPGSVEMNSVRKAKVVCVGLERLVDGVKTSITLCEGDKVLIDPLGGVKLKLNGEDVVLLRQEDVLARVWGE